MSKPKAADAGEALARDLERLCPGGVFADVSLADISRWRIGGTADLIVRPRSTEQLAALRGYIAARGLASVVIGATSNLLFADEGLRAIGIQIGSDFASLSIHGGEIVADPGVWVPGLVRDSMSAGLTGIEHACGIPGTLGGLVCMNGGSQRRGIGERVVTVESVASDGTIHTRTAEECGFAYRRSVFQSNGEVIARTTLQLEPAADKAACRRAILAILMDRRRKFPQKLPNCGSVFVSNPAMYAEFGPPGAIIEKLGFKGRRVGGALVSPQHANFIVNTGTARADEVRELIVSIKNAVIEKTGYAMEIEARFITPDGAILSPDALPLGAASLDRNGGTLASQLPG
ncbi:UDP-N-acetylmuramate dehydrogenase [Ancylobacter sp. A5.8]|uniref:UDP-N-acetylmuramate dehydrogenase n=1 Tax=Ancylobacter gelatini TaxID=2919920 RepID=UPI001F4D4D24|nr:UDP-N-acetylmuramate dehydrogenase [Ancylobacter gelatini]